MKEKSNYSAVVESKVNDINPSESNNESEVSENLNNDLENLNLFGKVKKMDARSYDALVKFATITRGEFIESDDNKKYEFNDKGFIVEETEILSDNFYGEKCIKEYDHQFNKIKEYYYDKVDDEEILSFYMEFIYNDNNLIEVNTYNADNDMIGKSINKYKDGLLQKVVNYSEDGSIENSLTKKYNNDNLPVEEISYDRHGDIKCVKIFKYNEVIKIRSITENNFIDHKNGMRRDEITVFFENKFIEKKVIYTLFPKVSLKEHYYKYDDYGNMIEETHNFNKDVYSWQYTYDSHNNWIKKIYYNNTVPKHITERIIEYYE